MHTALLAPSASDSRASLSIAPLVCAPLEDHILAATAEVAARFGIARLSVGDVARQAGVSRTTLYRHFPSKDELIAMTVVREASLILKAAWDASTAGPGGVPAVEAAFVAALRAARAHPLLHRLLETEPEALLPLVTGSRGPVMGQVREAVLQLLAMHLGSQDAAQLGLSVDAATRLLMSYVIAEPIESPETIGRFLAQTLCIFLTAPMDPPQATDLATEVSR